MRKAILVILFLLFLSGVSAYSMSNGRVVVVDKQDFLKIATLLNTTDKACGNECHAYIRIDSPKAIPLSGVTLRAWGQKANGTTCSDAEEEINGTTINVTQCAVSWTDDPLNISFGVQHTAANGSVYEDLNLQAGNNNILHLYTYDKPVHEAREWQFIVYNVPIRMGSKSLTLNLSTIDLGWATWGAQTVRAYYAFDTGYGDSTGTYAGTNSGTSISTTGIIGNGSLLMGTSTSRVTLPSGAVNSFQGFTWNQWMNLTGADQYDCIFDAGQAMQPLFNFALGNGPGYNCAGGQYKICFGGYYGSWYIGQEVDYTNYIGKETMLTYTVSNASPYNHSIYINGVLVASRTTTTNPTGLTTTSAIGTQTTQNRAVNGKVDDVTIANQEWNSSFIFTVWQKRANNSMITTGFGNDTAPTDSCTPTAGQNWIVNGSHNCNVTTSISLGGYNLTCSGTGTFTVNAATIGNVSYRRFGEGCVRRVVNAGKIIK